MGLRDKYAYAIQIAKSLHFEGSAQEQDEKLVFTGTASSLQDANKIWDAIKTVADWQQDIKANIRVNPTAQVSAAPGGAAGKTYTVKAGDTLSQIAEEQLGDANAYTEIFNANRDQLSDPNTIKPGQVLKVPHGVRR